MSSGRRACAGSCHGCDIGSAGARGPQAASVDGPRCDPAAGDGSRAAIAVGNGAGRRGSGSGAGSVFALSLRPPSALAATPNASTTRAQRSCKRERRSRLWTMLASSRSISVPQGRQPGKPPRGRHPRNPGRRPTSTANRKRKKRFIKRSFYNALIESDCKLLTSRKSCGASPPSPPI